MVGKMLSLISTEILGKGCYRVDKEAYFFDRSIRLKDYKNKEAYFFDRSIRLKDRSIRLLLKIN